VPRRYTKQQQLQRRKKILAPGAEKKGFSINENRKEKDKTNTPQCKLQKPREREI
jgi:type IV secretory pathway VirD2 relaxase